MSLSLRHNAYLPCGGPHTMSNLHRLLALILKSAVKARLLATSPIQDVQTKPKPKRKSIVILHETELAALLEEAGWVARRDLTRKGTGSSRCRTWGSCVLVKTDRSRRTIRLPASLLIRKGFLVKTETL